MNYLIVLFSFQFTLVQYVRYEMLNKYLFSFCHAQLDFNKVHQKAGMSGKIFGCSVYGSLFHKN